MFSEGQLQLSKDRRGVRHSRRQRLDSDCTVLFRLAPAWSEFTTYQENSAVVTENQSMPNQLQLKFSVNGLIVELNLVKKSGDVDNQNTEDFAVLVGERGRISAWPSSNASQVSFCIWTPGDFDLTRLTQD